MGLGKSSRAEFDGSFCLLRKGFSCTRRKGRTLQNPEVVCLSLPFCGDGVWE